nr:putative oxoglutarate dehydrogenase [Tanacetum cinerariifolium]
MSDDNAFVIPEMEPIPIGKLSMLQLQQIISVCCVDSYIAPRLATAMKALDRGTIDDVKYVGRAPAAATATDKGHIVDMCHLMGVRIDCGWLDEEMVYGLDFFGLLGLVECIASASNLRRIQVTDIVKEVEDQLKTYSSAEMNISLKGIIISCLLNDVMKSVIKCKTAKKVWNDLILAHKGLSDTSDTEIAALRLKFNAFKSLEGEKVNGTFTRLKYFLNDLENTGVIIQAEVNDTFVNSLPRKWLSMNQTQRDSDSDVEEDQMTNNEFMVDLNDEYHERALLDEGTTKIRAFMAIVEDEPYVEKADARSDYTHVDLYYVEDQRKNLVNKFHVLKQELSLHKSELCNLKNTVSINCSLQNEVISVNLENKSLKDEISDLKKVIEKWTCSKVTLEQLLIVSINCSLHEMDNQTSDTVSPTYVIKKKTNKTPAVPNTCSDKKVDSSTEQLFLTLMEEANGLKKQTENPSSTSLSISQSSSSKSNSGCSRHMTGVKQYLHRYSEESGPKVVFGDDSSENNVYFMEHYARKGDPIRSPTGIGAGLREHLSPMERPDKIPIGDRGGFGAWFANRIWGWRVAAPPQTRPIAIPTCKPRRFESFWNPDLLSHLILKLHHLLSELRLIQMARRVSDYRIRRITDRGNEKVDRDPGNISEIKGLRRRVRDLEIQHEIRQIRKRIRELELQREM